MGPDETTCGLSEACACYVSNTICLEYSSVDKRVEKYLVSIFYTGSHAAFGHLAEVRRFFSPRDVLKIFIKK
jgi:hypothetical protein